MKRLIIMGSPRSNGRSAHLAEMLFEACIDECPEDEQYLAPVSELEIAPCVACDACKHAGEQAAHARLDGRADDAPENAPENAGGNAGEDDLPPIAYCPRFDDDMLELYDILADADELTVVAPVFFSGAPAGLTALLDRLQPFFWEWLALRQAGDAGRVLAADKRPATLHVVGEGLDRNGYVALVSKVRSALAPAGFRLERVLDWVGKIDAEGTIQGDADEYALPPLGNPLVAADAYLEAAASAGTSEQVAAAGAQAGSAAAARPKLNLGAGGKGASGAKGGAKGGSRGGTGKRAGAGKNGKRRG